MRPGKRIGLSCLAVALSIAANLARALPQDKDVQVRSQLPQMVARGWVRRSNENAALVRTMERRLAPEFAADGKQWLRQHRRAAAAATTARTNLLRWEWAK